MDEDKLSRGQGEERDGCGEGYDLIKDGLTKTSSKLLFDNGAAYLIIFNLPAP
jgi:hypothetical protein